MYFGRDGMVSACCYNRSGSWGSYPVNSIAEIWSSAQAKSMRQSMRRNELPLGCSLCADQLIAGNFDGLLARQFDQNARSPILPRLPESQHTDGNGRYPVRLEFELSNKCNLECTMCSGFFSSSIRANRENLPPLPQLYGKEFVEQLLPFLPHLTQAKFLGGEPFLVDIYYDIWEKLIELNPLCQASITTNGTVFTEKVRRVLEKLNCVIVVSLDSVNQASYESIRRNASLERTLHNVEIFSKINRLSGRSLSIATCPMVSNWREIPEVISWASRLGMRVFLNTVVFPAAHSLKALQVTAQREVIEVYRSWSPELRSEVDYANRETLLELIRFKSTKVEGLTSLAEVKARMKDGQKSIYYITGGSESLLRTSPLLEIYKKKDLEVLILDDEVDEIVFSGVDKYGDIELKAVNKAATSEDLKDEAEPDKAEELKPLLAKLKATLGDRVKDVRASVRLADSPSCIVSDETEPSIQMQQMMRAMGQKDFPASKPTLEINPDHEIVKKLIDHKDDAVAEDAAWLLLDQALLMEGAPLENPATFVQRLNRILNLSI